VVIAYLNTVGGQDELVFDGLSMVYDHTGCLIAQAKAFEEELMIVDLDLGKTRKYRQLNGLCGKPRVAKTAPACRRSGSRNQGPGQGYHEEGRVQRDTDPGGGDIPALMLGTADYIRKNGFKGAVVGLSGGIDSSLVAAVATDAIGRENVTGVFMPSEFTSQESREDAFLLAENLGITITELPIGKLLREYKQSLVHQFEGLAEDITEENLQARIRGNLLMALSNNSAGSC